ncbi:MAG: Hsp70 family protein [Nannocystaceae bacterium]
MTDSTCGSFAIGIDLGTTNCGLAYADLQTDTARPQQLSIRQVIAPGEVSTRSLLPSFLYFPGEAEFAPGSMGLPWYPNARDVAGVFARAQGATTPIRLVSSAKSWLSHTTADRRGEILPWGAPSEIPRVSPLQASARYLAHLRAAWDESHPDTPLDEQDVVLTVPASFDAVARELTMEAAALAGFAKPPRLLEEPQAALYDWLAQRGPQWRQDVGVGDTILVIDIGGGTTDFSLILVAEQDGELQLERVAVGDHILLGGDNMDLALAHTVGAKLAQQGESLDDWQMRALTHGCRQAKEVLLADNPPVSYPLAIPSRGSKLIQRTIRTELRAEELTTVLIDGFLPRVASDAFPLAPRRLGLTTTGLPFASDAAITRHLAAFLARATQATGHTSPAQPSAILFNGGVTRSPVVRDRICQILGEWADTGNGTAPSVLSGTDAELAVSRGAAYYAHARKHNGLRIRSGTAQAHYIGLERAELAVPGLAPRMDAVCVAPAGMEEGTEVELDETFGLVLGEPVAFRFFGSPTRTQDGVGALVDPDTLTELSPIETLLRGEAGQIVQVRLHARVTEVGVLELSAVELSETDSHNRDSHDRDTPMARRWKLSFNVRLE